MEEKEVRYEYLSQYVKIFNQEILGEKIMEMERSNRWKFVTVFYTGLSVIALFRREIKD